MVSNTYSCFKIVIVSYLLFAIEVGKNEVAIAYKYKEVGINNSTELRWTKVQLGQYVLLMKVIKAQPPTKINQKEN